MTRYKELIKQLRELPHLLFVQLHGHEDVVYQAADAIEELEEKAMALAETLHAYENPWTMITSRPMTAEERAEWEEEVGYLLTDDYAVTYTCPLPADGQEVLICDIYGGIDKDVFISDNDGCYFEGSGDMDGIAAWMPLPKPPNIFFYHQEIEE